MLETDNIPGADVPAPDELPASRAGAAHRRRPYWPGLAEWALLAGSPLLAYVVLRVAVMSKAGLPDPSIHTAYVVDPRQFFARYQQALEATARMREGARVGFVVPARISYLLFGAVPGFVVFRYVLALVAVVPSYLLLKRLYGRPAGALVVVIVLSSPVFIRALGTDYPNAAAVPYLLASLAFLGLALVVRRRLLCVAAAGALLTAAIWAFASSLVVGGLAVAIYLAAHWVRNRKVPWRDVAVLAASAAAVTGLLAVGSYFLLGQANFIGPTWHSYVYLSKSSQEFMWHSRNWRWVLYDTYLLVLPAVAGVAAVTFLRRWRHRRSIPIVPAYLLLVLSLQIVLAVYLQFFHGVQMLEVHYWSSLLWAGVYLTLAVSLAEIAKTLPDDWFSRWLPAIALVAVPLVYEARGSAPAMKVEPVGMALVLGVVAAAALGRFGLGLVRRRADGSGETAAWRLAAGRLASGIVSIAAVATGMLLLTVAAPVTHRPIPRTVHDPPPNYAATLGGNDTVAIDRYRVVAELPLFTGNPAYRGEQLLIWWPANQIDGMIEPMGIFHAGYNSLQGPWGELSPAAQAQIEQRRPGQILLMSFSGWKFRSCLSALAPFEPRLVRRGVLASGPVRLHVWLIDLERFIQAHRHGAA